MYRRGLFALAALLGACGSEHASGIDSTTTSQASSSTDPTLTSTTTDETSSTEAPTTGETETGDESSSTTGPKCSDIIPCLDAEAPFCVDGTCSTCDATALPDEACATLDETAPLCVGTSCVQCTAEDASVCGGTSPLCDVEANTCVGCEFHEQCQDLDLPACNIATGACFDAAAVSEVNAGNPGTIQAAIDEVDDGAEHAIVLTDGGSLHTISIDGGKTIAIVSDSTAERMISGNTASPIVTVSGAGSTAYLHRVRIDGSSGVGISVASNATLYADSTRVSGNDGGGIELASGTSGFLRNCMVQGVGTTSTAISSSGELVAVYSSFGRTANFGAPVVECASGSASIRNSLIVSETNTTGDEVSCGGIMLENTATESTQTPAEWFGSGFASGDYSLTSAGQTEFANIAIWETGDPPFDFDGDARPAVDGERDYAGSRYRPMKPPRHLSRATVAWPLALSVLLFGLFGCAQGDGEDRRRGFGSSTFRVFIDGVYKAMEPSLEAKLRSWDWVRVRSTDELAVLVGLPGNARRPVVIYFFAKWDVGSGPLIRDVLGDPSVREHLEEFTLVYVDVSNPGAEEEALKAALDSRVLPRVHLFESGAGLARALHRGDVLRPRATLRETIDLDSESFLRLMGLIEGQDAALGPR